MGSNIWWVGHVRTHLEADAVAQTHLEQCLGHTAVARRGGGQHLALVDHLFDGLVNGNQAADLGADRSCSWGAG